MDNIMLDELHKGNSDGGAAERKGKLLRVKAGYNPNSSSLGSDVFGLPTAMLAVPVLFSVATAIIVTSFTHRDPQDGKNAEPGEAEPGTGDQSLQKQNYENIANKPVGKVQDEQI